MFKLFEVCNGTRKEVISDNGFYTVKEMQDYEFTYQVNEPNLKYLNAIFLEDMLIDKEWYVVNNNMILGKKNKYFQDYFGFAALTINGEIFKLNIQIEKLKLSEIEEIMVGLWEDDNRLFHNFFSKSSVKANISKFGSEIGSTSKFLVFVQNYIEAFQKLLPHFKNNSHSLLRKKSEIVDYSPQMVSPATIDWILINLDNINFDDSLNGLPDAINIENKYGYIEKIQSERNDRIYDVYENQIILGSFYFLLNKLKKLKSDILSAKILNEEFGRDGHFDFRDLKRIPFVKLFDDAESLEVRLLKLSRQFKQIFGNCLVRDEKPRLTPVFSKKNHYKASYKLIQDSKEIKYNFDGELPLLNIKKLSQLYEAYNLLQIVRIISNKINEEKFSRSNEIITSDGQFIREDGLPARVIFQNPNCTINIFYELRYPSKKNNTTLTRIQSDNGSYYEPDYVIEIITQSNSSYCILDAKYTRETTLKRAHLPYCVYKYILNTGFIGDRFRKVDYLILLYPGDNKEIMINNPNFSPKIFSIPSKPKKEQYLQEFIHKLLTENVPELLLNEGTLVI